MYSQIVIDRFTNPKNAGHLKYADASGSAGNPDASDVIKYLIRVENNKIVEAKFKAFGCVVAIASADVVVDLIVNRTLENASKITSSEVLDVLGEIDDNKIGCVSVAIEALHQTLEDYKEKLEEEKEREENGGATKAKKKTKKTKKA